MRETEDSQPLAVKPVGVAVVGETPSLTGESAGETHGVVECTQTHPPGSQHLTGHNPLVRSERNDGKWGKSQASGTVPSLTPSPHTAHNCPALVNT